MAAAGGEVPGEWPRAASGSCTLMKVVEEPLQLLRLLFMSGKPVSLGGTALPTARPLAPLYFLHP